MHVALCFLPFAHPNQLADVQQWLGPSASRPVLVHRGPVVTAGTDPTSLDESEIVAYPHMLFEVVKHNGCLATLQLLP